MRVILTLVCTMAALGLLAMPAFAADQLLNGTKLIVKDTGNRSRLVFQTRDELVTVGVGANAPTSAGMRFELRNPVTGESATFDLPARLWRANRPGTKFAYRDRRGGAGPVRNAILRNGRFLRVTVDNTGISLDEPSQGSLAVVMTGGDQRYCALFAASSVRRDVPCKFIARRSARPIACPAGAIGGSPGGAFLAPVIP